MTIATIARIEVAPADVGTSQFVHDMLNLIMRHRLIADRDFDLSNYGGLGK